MKDLCMVQQIDILILSWDRGIENCKIWEKRLSYYIERTGKVGDYRKVSFISLKVVRKELKKFFINSTEISEGTITRTVIDLK